MTSSSGLFYRGLMILQPLLALLGEQFKNEQCSKLLCDCLTAVQCDTGAEYADKTRMGEVELAKL